MTDSEPHRDDQAELSRVEQLLGRFAPRPSRLDRDRLMYLAGQSAQAATAAPVPPARGRTPWYWPVSTALSSLTAAVLAVLLVSGPMAGSTTPAAAGPRVVKAAPLPPPDSDEQHPSGASAAGLPQGFAQAADPGQFTPLPTDNLLRLREIALRRGVDSLPMSEPAMMNRGAPTTYGQALYDATQRLQ